MKKSILIVIYILFITACGNVANITEEKTATYSSFPTLTQDSLLINLPSVTATPLPIPSVTLDPGSWKSLPVIPTQAATNIIYIFNQGLALGRDPSHFSKIGDCQNITPYFLSEFDDPSKYRLGSQYEYLFPTIEHFSGSWSRSSLATHGGFNAATVLSPFWTIVARPSECEKGETPAACEIRVYNPSFAIISMEEAWSGDLQKYDHYMRMLVEFVLSQNVVPILATRAEAPNSQISINSTVVQIAYDYNVPLWNFAASTLALPNYGLSADGFHLSPGTVEGNYYFDDPTRMELGWTWRNLTALQAIDAVYRFVGNQP